MLREYQVIRYRTYVQQAVKDAAAGRAHVQGTVAEAAFRARQQEWVHEPWDAKQLPATAVGDTVAIARRLQKIR